MLVKVPLVHDPVLRRTNPRQSAISQSGVQFRYDEIQRSRQFRGVSAVQRKSHIAGGKTFFYSPDEVALAQRNAVARLFDMKIAIMTSAEPE